MKVHQNIVIDGVDYGRRSVRKHSKFCNEGKWENFIKPQLPKDCSGMSFLEIGCNAGLHLSLAKKHGFRRVIGIVKDKDAYDMAVKYRDSLGLDYDIWHEDIKEGYDVRSLPTVDFVLMANSHYYVFIPVFLDLVETLRRKTRSLILVSVQRAKVTRHYPLPDVKNVRHYFRLWQQTNYIRSDDPGDPHPRSMYSIRFETELERRNIDEITSYAENKLENCRLHLKRVRHSLESGRMKPLIDGVRQRELTFPILLRNDGLLLDGSHRIIAAKAAGLDDVIVEICRSKG